MPQSIETIRLSEKQKQQLVQLKRKTCIENWNVLCRWAICTSLAEESAPPIEDTPSDSNIEMSWKVFAGEYSNVYLAILKQIYQIQSPKLNNISFNDFFKLHLNRGISFFLKNTR